MRASVVGLLLTAAACKSTPAETSTTSSTSTTTPTATPSVVASVTAKPADITWTPPAAWATEPSGGMRKAAYRVTKVAGDKEDAIVTVIQAGGLTDDNVARWKTQFTGAHDFTRTESKAGDVPVTLVEVHGTYTGGGMMVGESPDPRDGWALVGAIVQTGSQPYFFKMLGPDKTVAAAKHDFQALVDSVHPK